MDRPYIFCHMMTSLDSKIMEPYMDTPQALRFTFQEAKVIDKGTIWLRYTIHP